MSLQIQENVGKILKSQNCKRKIESKLITKRVKKSNEPINKDRIQLGFMMFQVVKDGVVSDYWHLFPCVFDLKGEDQRGIVFQRQQKQAPKVGSYIRTRKMDFDLKTFNLIIYDYQYLGGAGSTVPTSGTKVNWNSETISQIIRRNNTVKGGQVLLDSYINDKLSQTQLFEYPSVQFASVKVLKQILTVENAQSQNLPIHNIQKITAPKLDIANQEKQEPQLDMVDEGKQESQIKDDNKDQKNLSQNIKDLQL